MKRVIALTIPAMAVLVTGCTLFSPAPVAEAPTQTLYPTYTLYPTFTPPPTATATFLPSPTPSPDVTVTPTVDPAATLPAATSSGGMQAVLLYDSNLREGPGTSFDSVTMLGAGEPITILGRDLNGGWVYVRTSSGLEGWVRVTQIQGPLDIPRIPLAPQIPTPNVTAAATAAATASGTGTPSGSGTPAASTSTPAPTSGTLSFDLTAGAGEECQQVIWELPQRFEVQNVDGPIIPFETANPQSVVGRTAYRFFRLNVPEFIDVKIKGNITPGACNESDSTCKIAIFQMCSFAPASAPTGGSEYRQNVTLQIGTQSYSDFFLTVETFIPTSFVVKAP